MDEKTILTLIQALSSSDDPATVCANFVTQQWPFIPACLGRDNLAYIITNMLEVRV